MSEVAYAEFYASIHLSEDPALEERRVQRLLAVNRIEMRMAGSLEVAKRAGEIYATYLKKRGEDVKRILPDFLIGAHAEVYGSQLATWNPQDLRNYLKIDVSTPKDLIPRG
jgi:predicted nucleic acid-binding protein